MAMPRHLHNPLGPRLTPKQRRHMDFLKHLFWRIGLDYEETIPTLESAGHRTAELERVRDHLIRAEVISSFAISESALNYELARAILKPRLKRVRSLANQFADHRLSMEMKL